MFSQVPDDRKHCRVLVFGRGDPEDFATERDLISQQNLLLHYLTLILFLLEHQMGNTRKSRNVCFECGISASRLRIRRLRQQSREFETPVL